MGAPRYRLRSADVRIAPLSDLTLAFQRLSGETHVLSPESAALLDVIGTGTLSLDDMHAALARDYDFETADKNEALTALGRLCESLEDVGLLERA